MSTRLLGIATQVMVMAIIVSVVLLFLGIGVLVLIHVCVVGRALGRGLRGTAGGGGRYGSGNNGLSKEDLEKLPCYEFKPGEKSGVSGGGDCAVCLECFQARDRCRLLPLCGHSFHAQCVDSWLMKSSVCPICRTSAGDGKSGMVPPVGEEGRFSVSVGLELRESTAVVVRFPTGSGGPSPLQGSTSG